jgi:hypothetical protein
MHANDRGQGLFFQREGRIYKVCPQCKNAYPFNIIYYCKNPRQPTGLSYSCKLCEKKRIVKYKEDLKKGYKPPDEKRYCQKKWKAKKEINDRLKSEMKELAEKARVEKLRKKKEIGEDDLFYGLL